MATLAAQNKQLIANEVALKPRFIFHCIALLVVIAAVVFA